MEEEKTIHATHADGSNAGGLHDSVISHLSKRGLPLVAREDGLHVPEWVMTLVHLQERRGHAGETVDWSAIWKRLPQDRALRSRIVGLAELADAAGVKHHADELMIRALRRASFLERYPGARGQLTDVHDHEADLAEIVEEERAATKARLARQIEMEAHEASLPRPASDLERLWEMMRHARPEPARSDRWLVFAAIVLLALAIVAHAILTSRR